MNQSSILLVEDDAAIRNLVTTTLDAHNYQVSVASNGETAILESTAHPPDVILLDLGLPDMDGIHIIRKIRSWSTVPILVISARSEERDKIDALDAGADDYLTKPFSIEELLARVRVALRRLRCETVPSPLFVNGSLKIDYCVGSVYLDEEELHLTPMEYKLICLLARNVGKVLTHTFLTNHVWGTSLENDVSSLRVFMATLRKKLQQDATTPPYIQTHVGVGYRMMRL